MAIGQIDQHKIQCYKNPDDPNPLIPTKECNDNKQVGYQLAKQLIRSNILQYCHDYGSFKFYVKVIIIIVFSDHLSVDLFIFNIMYKVLNQKSKFHLIKKLK